MNKEVLDYVVEKTHELIDAQHAATKPEKRLRPGWMHLGQMPKLRKRRSILTSWRQISCRSTP